MFKKFRAEELSRPNTHTSWVSTTGGAPLCIDNTFNNSTGIYGSIASGFAGGSTSVAGVSNVYQALATDALPSDVCGNTNFNYFANFEKNSDFDVKNDEYFLHHDLKNNRYNEFDLLNKKSTSSSPPLFTADENGANFNLKNYNTASKFKNNSFGPSINQLNLNSNNYQYLASDYDYGKLSQGF